MAIWRGVGGSGDATTDAGNEASAAVTAANNAAASATAAASSATTASTSATNAATSETNASTSATNAASSATSASSSASTATTQASNASTSATSAASSASAASTSATNAATSATNAATSETNAGTSETNAATSETNAASSATAAASSATSAASSATAAASSASSASTSASNASTSETNAGTSETNAATSATNAASSATAAASSASAASTSASNASTSETNAATSASNASTSASNASTSETNAANSATSAANSATSAAASYDSFDDRYLGAKSSAPTLDNDGDALLTGALYYNTTTSQLYVWTGSAWDDAAFSGSGSVTSFNTRTGAVTLTSSDVNTALGSDAVLDSDIGSTVQAYDVDTAKYDDVTANFTGTLQNNGSNVVVDSDIGTNVQAYSSVLAGTTASYTTAEETKLAGIETGATADQTAGEIKTAYESNANTNAFTDAEQTKLSGIEALADVTDTTNVTAAGAVMDSELTSEASVKALNQGVATTDSPSFAGLTVDTDTLYVDSTNNRVGIGTSSPNADGSLDVVGGRIRQQYTGASAGMLFGQYDSSGTAHVTNQANAALWFGTNNAERMRIDSSGNVGIGTSSPSYDLEINDASDPTIRLYDTRGGTQADVRILSHGATGVGRIGTYSAKDFALMSNSTERMRIDSSGNVGIGTSSPLGKLKVAVGDNAPAASGDMNTGVVFESGYGSRAINIGVNNTSGYSWINAAFANNSSVPDNLVLMTGVTERMRINSSGNVGIGTSSPSTKLQVNGTVTATSFSGSGSGLTGISGTITYTSGSPAYYGARSFINMQGDGTVAIRNSQNVSSIADDGTGLYTINFSTAMPDANFTVVSQGSWTNANTSDHSPYVVAVRGRQEDSHNASWVKMAAGVNYQPGIHSAARYDADTVEVAIFR